MNNKPDGLFMYPKSKLRRLSVQKMGAEAPTEITLQYV